MTAWSDVWRSAQLRLQLRDECLFQGETVGVDVCADVPPSVGSTGKYEGQQRVDTLLQRWKAHCEGAQAQIQIVDESSPDPHASSSRSTSTTLFRQETQFSVVSVDREDGNPASVVRLRAHFDLKVRREFWDRKVLLVVNITPRRSVDEGMQSDMKTASGERERSLLMDEWTSELLSLTREEAQPTLTMTRRVERHVTVTKPLRLDVETKDLEKRRVGILARVTNTHPTLSLSVRDLHLHLNQSLRGTEAGSFRVVSGDKVPFPVVLLPQERYNFLYMLEPEEVVASQESSEDQVPTSAVQRKAKVSATNRVITAQHTLLTLSWQAVAVAMEAVVENRTIVWSPKPPPLSADMLTLVSSALEGQFKRSTEFRCQRLLPESALHATIRPLPSSIEVGSTVTVCVAVLNRSTRTDFDLTLVFPLQKDYRTAPAFVGFEASHRLGLIRPGMSARRSLHIAFLRSGKSTVGPLVLVDNLTCTCYLTDEWSAFVK